MATTTAATTTTTTSTHYNDDDDCTIHDDGTRVQIICSKGTTFIDVPYLNNDNHDADDNHVDNIDDE